MSDMDERIERAAKALRPNDWELFAEGFGLESDRRRWEAAKSLAARALRAAFPELFGGTAWMAPMEPTEAMCIAWGETMPVTAVVEWRTMRDAHLKGQETGSKVEG